MLLGAGDRSCPFSMDTILLCEKLRGRNTGTNIKFLLEKVASREPVPVADQESQL